MDEVEKKRLIHKKEEEIEWWMNIKDESANKEQHGFSDLFIH